MSESKGGNSGSPDKGASGGAGKTASGTRKAANGVRGRQSTTPKIVPIYARLPRGPHPLGSSGVARNQRIRIHGGMIEAVTTRGYPHTSVKLVIGLAGVSRRSFYEQFSGKEECFLATFDLIVNRAIKRLTHAYRTADGGLEERLRAALRAWCDELEQSPKALRLVVAEAPTAGAEGLRRVHTMTTVCEGLLSNALANRCPRGDEAGEQEAVEDEPRGHKTEEQEAEEQEAVDHGARGHKAEEHDAAVEPSEPPPLPVARAIVGGLRRATRMRLLDYDTEALGPLVEEMAKWSLLLGSPEARTLRPYPCANRPFPAAPTLGPDACGGKSRRAQVLRGAIESALHECELIDLNTPRIAECAGLPIEAVTELYSDPRACYLEALEVLGDELLQLIAGPQLLAPDWPEAVCAAVEQLLAHLATSPARLLTLTVKAMEAGPEAIASIDDLAYELATLLTEGAPRRARTRIAVEGIAGGLWQILHCEALAGRGHLLPVLSQYVSYVVLAPYLGPKGAAEAIERSRSGPAVSAERTAPVNGASSANSTSSANGAHVDGAAPANGSAPDGEGDYRRLAERRSAKWVNTTPTNTDATITTIKGT